MKLVKSYLFLAAAVTVMYLINHLAVNFIEISSLTGLEAATTQTAIAISSIFISAFLVFYLSSATKIPSFVVAILLGIVSRGLLEPITSSNSLVTIIVGISATLILFSGGLEMPFDRFKKIAPHVGLLATLGVVATTLFFAFSFIPVAANLGTPFTFSLALLLGAILSSTDPTVLIPLMKDLRFKSIRMKDMIIAESAVTDVTGALLTLLLVDGIHHATTREATLSILFSSSTGTALLEHLILGIIFGVLGYGFLLLLAKIKTDDNREHDVDAAFFLFVPIVIYALANTFGGSGLLAAFISGLLFKTTDFLHETEKFFNHIIDGFVKPTVFILLGAIVPLSTFLSFAPLGIIISLIFILLIRPLSVLISLLPLSPFKKLRLKWQEFLALSAIRETGAVPAVLIMSLATIPEIGTPGFISIGMWVILLTIAFPPTILPWLYDKLGIAGRIPHDIELHIEAQEEPFVILATRGGSYSRRLPKVAKWALKHNIHRVCVLFCLEDKFTPDCLEAKLKNAEKQFTKLHDKFAKQDRRIDFFYTATDGYLHDAIESIDKKSSKAVAVFVGKKMLDFRLEEIQNLDVPLNFID